MREEPVAWHRRRRHDPGQLGRNPVRQPHDRRHSNPLRYRKRLCPAVSVTRRIEKRLDSMPVQRIRRGAPRQIRLRVRINRKHPFPPLKAHARKQPHRVRLTNAPFEVDDGENRGVGNGGLGHEGMVALVGSGRRTLRGFGAERDGTGKRSLPRWMTLADRSQLTSCGCGRPSQSEWRNTVAWAEG